MSNELAEVQVLAAELGRAYRQTIDFYRTRMQMTPEAATAQASELYRDVLTDPSEQIYWMGLSRLAEHDPDAAYALWQRIKQDARAELDTGVRAASVMETGDARPWQRAQFLVILDSFIEEWHPSGGIERAMVDVLAQAHASYLHWMDVLTYRSEREAMREKKELQDAYTWNPPRVSDQVAIDNAAAMVDRFNRLFLRTLRQLRDLRRYAPAMVINNPSQVNIGSQQVIAQQSATNGNRRQPSGDVAEPYKDV